MKEENCVEKRNNADIIEIIAGNDSNGSIINAFRDSFRYILLLTVAVASGCISSVKVTKTYTTWEPIGEDMRTVEMPPKIEISLDTNVVNLRGTRYIDIFVKRTCETRGIKRKVEQALYHEEQEGQDMGLEIGLAFVTIIPPMTVASPFLFGHNIYTACKATDDEEWKDDVRQTQEVIFSKDQDCTTNVPLVLRTSKGVYPLGVTDEEGYLRVQLENVIPSDILMSIINETAVIEVGKN